MSWSTLALALGGRLGGGDDSGDEDGDGDGAGLDAQLGESDVGLCIGRGESSLPLADQGLLSLWRRVAWRCLWQQLGGAGRAACRGKGLVVADVVAIKELRNAERWEREKVGSGGIRNGNANA